MDVKGKTFTDNDVTQCGVVIGLLNQVDSLKLGGVKQIFEAKQALDWLSNHYQVIKDHVFEVKDVIDNSDKEEKPEPAQPEPKPQAKPIRTPRPARVR